MAPLLVAGLAWMPGTAFAAPSLPPPGAVAADGPIRAIATGPSRVFFGGEFKHVGSYVGSNLRLDWDDGTLKPGFARTNGQISDIVPDGTGGWYLGGGFDRVEGSRRSNLVHISGGGQVDPAFDAKVDGFVSALALAGGRLYVAGTLKSVGGRARRGLAAVHPVTGALDTAFEFDGSLPVLELAAAGPEAGGAGLLFAQQYTDFNGPGPIQALDPRSGAVLPGFQFPFDARKVGALAVDGETLYVGGGQGHYTGTHFGDAGPLVAVDARTGALDREFRVPVERTGTDFASVEDIELDGERLVIGGRFDSVGSLASAGVAVLDKETGRPDTAFDADVEERVSDVALADGLVHAGTGNRIVTLDSAGGRASTEAPRLDAEVDALATQGGVLYAGGRFSLTGAVRRRGLAAIERGSGRVVAGFRPRSGPGTHAQLALAHGRLYVGDYRGTRGEIAAVSPQTGALLSGFRTPASDPVYDFAVGPELVYGAVGGVPRVLAFDANTGRRARGFRVRTGGYVTDIDHSRGRLLLAGNWDPPGGRRAVIAVREQTGQLVAPFDPRVNGEVQALAAQGRRIFLAGPFGRAGGTFRPGGAAVWLPGGGVDRAFRPRGMPRRGAELAAGGGHLYARNTRTDRLKVFATGDGRRMAFPRFSRFTAVAPGRTLTWFGAGIGGAAGRTTWFLGSAAPGSAGGG